MLSLEGGSGERGVCTFLYSYQLLSFEAILRSSHEPKTAHSYACGHPWDGELFERERFPIAIYIYIYIYVYTYWVRLHRRVTTTIFECSCCTSTVCSWQLYLSVHATAACCSCAVPLLYSSMQLYFCCSAACSWSVQQKKFEPEIKFLKDFFSAKRGDFTHKYWGNTSVNYLKQLIRIKIYKNRCMIYLR